jgi:hypothetical protein
MTDFLVGATAGLSSSVFYACTAGQASSGTHTIIPLCHMPTKRRKLSRTTINAGIQGELGPGVRRGDGNVPLGNNFREMPSQSELVLVGTNGPKEKP